MSGPNREKVKAPRRVLVWCAACDCQLVQPGTKCARCGKREPSKRLKK